jgi:hypothetical protein
MAKDSFFEHSSIDKIMKVTMAIARELYVTRDRLAALELELQRVTSFKRETLDRYDPTPEERAAAEQERQAFVASILAPITEEPIV